MYSINMLCLCSEAQQENGYSMSLMSHSISRQHQQPTKASIRSFWRNFPIRFNEACTSAYAQGSVIIQAATHLRSAPHVWSVPLVLKATTTDGELMTAASTVEDRWNCVH